MSDLYLVHHGVKGMKWGVRHDKNRKSEKKKRRAEDKYYRNILKKAPRKGSIADRRSGGKGTEAYNYVASMKGKQYADKLDRSIWNKRYAMVPGIWAAYAGMIYLYKKNGWI